MLSAFGPSLNLRASSIPLALVLMLSAGTARAQFDTPVGDVPRGWKIDFNILPSVVYGVPQKLSIDITGALLGHTPTYAAGPFVTISPGVGATRAAAGYELARTTFIARASLAVLKTKGQPWRAPARASYWGGQLQAIPYGLVGLRVGAFRRRHASGDAARGLFTVDASLFY